MVAVPHDVGAWAAGVDQHPFQRLDIVARQRLVPQQPLERDVVLVGSQVLLHLLREPSCIDARRNGRQHDLLTLEQRVLEVGVHRVASCLGDELQKVPQALNHAAGEAGLALGQGLDFVQTAQEEKVGDLFDHFQRVGDAPD